jgi:hypothetical protein
MGRIRNVKINWSTDDRSALGQWLKSDLGRKFYQFISQDRPAIPETADPNALIIAAGSIKGYEKLLDTIAWMGTLSPQQISGREHVDILTD